MPEATDPAKVGKAGIEGKCLLRKPGDLPAHRVKTGGRGVPRRGANHRDHRFVHLIAFRQTSRRAMTVTLHVCITCRAGQELQAGETAPGARLHAAILDAGPPEGVRVVAVECLSACSQGCSVALSAPGRWSYVYGRLSDSHAGDVIAGAAAYAAAPDGIVPWRSRPEIFRKQSLARIPPVAALPEAAE
jgi:predicted metal-binding protein